MFNHVCVYLVAIEGMTYTRYFPFAHARINK